MRNGLIFLVWMLAACVPGKEKEMAIDPVSDGCGAKMLQHLIGEKANAHDFKAGGTPLRILPPGSAMTMDHRPDRLNMDVDEGGLITRIWCG